MKICSKCGTEAGCNEKFCTKCGNNFYIKCPQCGRELDKSVIFCSSCGAKCQEEEKDGDWDDSASLSENILATVGGLALLAFNLLDE